MLLSIIICSPFVSSEERVGELDKVGEGKGGCITIGKALPSSPKSNRKIHYNLRKFLNTLTVYNAMTIS